MKKYIVRALDVFQCEIRSWYKDFENTDDAVKYAKEVLKGSKGNPVLAKYASKLI